MSDSDPPPSSSASEDRPLTLVGVAGWSFFTLVLFMVSMQLSASLRPGLGSDLVNAQVCFSLAFSVSTLLLAQTHLTTHSTADAVGARAVPWPLVLLGLLVGVALQAPALWLDGLVERVWPQTDEELAALVTMTTFQSRWHKAAFALVVTLIGPMFEEVFCRGVMFRALRRSHPSAVAVAASTAVFALIHLDLRFALNAAVCGVVLGLVRLWSGSVWVSLAGHVAFNTTTVVGLFAGWVKAGERTPPLGAGWGLGGIGLLALLLVVVYRFAQRSDLVQDAVTEDTC